MECYGNWNKQENILLFEIRDDASVGRAEKHRLYAFYVFHNGKRIITRWYEKSREIEVKILGDGLYYAAGFVKENDSEPEIMTSLPIQILQKREPFEVPAASVSIFGSCVSRDMLEYEAACDLTLDLYFARSSIISAVSDKVALDYEKINLQSNFKKRQIYYDFNKYAINMFRDKTSDYLIIDLVDERFPLIKVSGSYVTRSGALLESGIISESEPIIEKEEYVDVHGEHSYRVEGIDVREYLDKFCDRILKIYKPEKIILHVVRGAEFYYDEHKEIQKFEPNIAGYFKRLNKMWNFMYEYLSTKMAGCMCIDVSAAYLADEAHVWGLSPIHFQKEYYERVLEEISRKGCFSRM